MVAAAVCVLASTIRPHRAAGQPTFGQTDLHEAARRLGTLSTQMNAMLSPMLSRDGDHLGFVFDGHYDRVSDLRSTVEGEPAEVALDRAFVGVGTVLNLGARDRWVGGYLGGFAYGVSQPLAFVAPPRPTDTIRSGSEPIGQQLIDDTYGVVGRYGDFRARAGYATSRALDANPRLLSDAFPSTVTHHALELGLGWRGLQADARIGVDPGRLEMGWLSGDVTELTWALFDVEAAGRRALILPRIAARVGIERYGGQVLDVGARGTDVFVGWRYIQPVLGLLPDRFILPPKGLSALSFETQGSFALGRPALRDAQIKATVGFWLEYVRLEATAGASYFSDPGLVAIIGASSVGGTYVSGSLGVGMDTLDYLSPQAHGDWVFELFGTVSWRESWAEDLLNVIEFAQRPTLEFRVGLLTRL